MDPLASRSTLHREVGFLLVFAYVKTVAFPIDFPVEVRISSPERMAVLLELDAEALVRRTVEPEQKPSTTLLAKT